jgi:hypothetical protein
MNPGLRSRVLSLSLFGLLGACAAAPAPVPVLNDSEKFHAVLSWMECDECYSRQLEYVVGLGSQMNDMLDDARRGAGRFEAVLDVKRAHYLELGRQVGVRTMGLDPENVSEAERASVERYAERFADHFIGGDRRRYAARAEAALARLGRSWPRRE